MPKTAAEPLSVGPTALDTSPTSLPTLMPTTYMPTSSPIYIAKGEKRGRMLVKNTEALTEATESSSEQVEHVIEAQAGKR